MRLFTMLAASIGALLCLATAGTGIYFGMLKHPEMRETHLQLAISCVCVSLVAHLCSLHMLRKKS